MVFIQGPVSQAVSAKEVVTLRSSRRTRRQDVLGGPDNRFNYRIEPQLRQPRTSDAEKIGTPQRGVDVDWLTADKAVSRVMWHC